jgi:hypothetical protein
MDIPYIGRLKITPGVAVVGRFICLDSVGAFSLGSASSPVTSAIANQKWVSRYAKTTATSGDARLVYNRLYFTGAGGSGECGRFYSTINGVSVATGGTVNGAHISLDTIGAGAKVAGAANACRFTFGIAAATTALGGTCAVIQVDTDIKTGAALPTKMPYFRITDSGDIGLDYLLGIEGLSTSLVANAGTGGNSCGLAGGGIAAKAIKCRVGATDYWLPLFSSNS